MSGTEWIVVKTDATGALAEANTSADRQTVASLATTIAPAPGPVLTVSTITPPSAALSGQPTVVSWVVTNTGSSGTTATYWTDRVYLSLDRTLDTSDTLLASVQNPTYLGAGESYLSSATITLPKGISGPYYIIVYTEAASTVVASRVAASSAFPVTAAPESNLQVSHLVTPSQDFSGQNVALHWTVTNTGAAATDTGTWTDEILLSQNGSLDASAIVLGAVTHSGVLGVGQSYTGSATVTLPVGISGSYTLFVVADSGNQITEPHGTGLHTASTTIQVNLTPPPDLEPTLGTLPAATITGHTLTVSYTTHNNGATATPNSSWTDSLYLSRTSSLGTDAILLGSAAHYGALDAGQSYSVSQTYTLADTLSGQYYVIVNTDSENSVFELDNANNVVASASPITIAFSPVDLTVAKVKATATATAGHQLLVSWQVINTGSGDTGAANWTDQIILSASGVPGAVDNIVLATVANQSSLGAKGNYTSTATVDLPSTLAGGYTLFVVTNSDGALSESSTANDVSSGLHLDVVGLPALQVSAVTAPVQDTASDTVSVSWTVSNTGLSGTGATGWSDAVYLSTTPDLSRGYIALGQVQHSGALAAGGSYTASGTFTVPGALASGTYYFVVVSDIQQQVQQASRTGDLAGSSADAITALPGSPGITPITPSAPSAPTVAVLPASDIAVSAVTTSTEVLSGQQLAVTCSGSQCD